MTDTTRTRTLILDRKASKGNVFPAVATTESPVLRGDFYEVLEMSRVDLTRAPLPFIESHDTGAVNIGICENLRTDSDKLRCDVRFGSSARAKELAADIRDGVVTGLSIGYSVRDPIEDNDIDGIPVVRFGFTPLELSAVSVPADVNAGFFRSSNMETEKLTRSERRRENQTATDEHDRVAAIRGLADAHNLPALGMQAIAENWSEKEFQRTALAEVGARNTAARSDSSFVAEPMSHSPNHYSGLPCDNTQYGRAMERYSLVKVLRGISDPRQLPEAGLELEMSQDMQRVLGKRTQGVLIPYEALQTRATTIGGSGANLVGTDHLSGSFIDVLRNRSMVMSLGPTVLRGLVGDISIPKKSATTTAYWIAADDGDAVTASDPTLTGVDMSPNTVGGATTFSHKMLVQSSPDIEVLVRQDLADMIASEIDLKAISGTGSNNQPTGVLATSGIGTVDFAADNPTYAEIVQMETALANANTDRGNLAWLMDPDMAAALKTTPRQASGVEGHFIWSPDSQSVLTIPAYRTGNMTSGYILLGNWQHLLVGFWGGIEIMADPYGSNFLKGSVTVRVLADVDINVRHAGAFVEGHNAP